MARETVASFRVASYNSSVSLRLLKRFLRFDSPSVTEGMARVTRCFFASDLHGRTHRYMRLFAAINDERPEIVFLGGDLLPNAFSHVMDDRLSADFIADFLAVELDKLKNSLSTAYPRFLAILGNDDPQAEEPAIHDLEQAGLLEYLHNRPTSIGPYQVFGYPFTPPSPFQLKDWERYDVSRHVDVGAVSPEDGYRTVPVPEEVIRYSTIAEDLENLVEDTPLDQAVFLFHAPPYQSKLDRADLDGKTIDHAPLDVHVGSIAIRRFIQEKQPYLTMHGHIHESPRITGSWRDQIGKTTCLSGSHDGKELSLVRFALENPQAATRELV